LNLQIKLVSGQSPKKMRFNVVVLTALSFSATLSNCLFNVPRIPLPGKFYQYDYNTVHFQQLSASNVAGKMRRLIIINGQYFRFSFNFLF
jgi:hypothetical protein